MGKNCLVKVWAGSKLISLGENYIHAFTQHFFLIAFKLFKWFISCRKLCPKRSNFIVQFICLYGDFCQFAHGKHELRKDFVRHNKYKTKLCQEYWIQGYCAYGPRCNFIHQEKEGLVNIQQAQELPGQIRSGFADHSSLYKTASDVIGLAHMRKASLMDSAGDSGSDDVGSTKIKGLQVPIFYPREKTVSGSLQ